MSKKFMVYTLEGQTRFLFEKRTKAYKWYGEGVSQKKIEFDTQSGWQDWALLKLERRGV